MIANFETLINQLRDHEGEKLTPYVDTVGKLTIGVGRNLTDRGISPEESRFLLMSDIKIALKDALGFQWFEDLNDIRQRAILDLLFNLGRSRFLTFRKAITALNRFDFETAANEFQDSLWFRQVKRRGPRIVHMIRTGEDPPGVEW